MLKKQVLRTKAIKNDVRDNLLPLFNSGKHRKPNRHNDYVKHEFFKLWQMSLAVHHLDSIHTRKCSRQRRKR